MSLDAYKLDKAFTEGVELRLDKAPDDVFVVKLPSQYNRGYTSAVYGAMQLNIGEDGKVKAAGDMMATRYKQEDAFVDHCIVSLNGEPLPEGFVTEYPEALTELMAMANDLANAIDGKVDSTVKKSSASSTGSRSGQAEKSSTESSKRQAG
jgi:hypothetical protein